jgi:hypothetical protein
MKTCISVVQYTHTLQHNIYMKKEGRYMCVHLTYGELLICMVAIAKCADIFYCVSYLQENFGYNSSPLHLICS